MIICWIYSFKTYVLTLISHVSLLLNMAPGNFQLHIFGSSHQWHSWNFFGQCCTNDVVSAQWKLLTANTCNFLSRRPLSGYSHTLIPLHGRAVVSKSEWPGGSLSPMVSSELDKYTSFLAFHWGQVSHGSAMTGSAVFHGVRQQNRAPKKTHSITSPSWNSLPSLTHFCCLNTRVQRF